MTIIITGVNIRLIKIYKLIGDKLNDKVIYVTTSKEAELWLKEQSCDVKYIPDYKHYKYTKCILDSIETIYGIKPKTILFGDIEHSAMFKRNAYKQMIKHFRFWEDLLTEDITIVIGSLERYIGMIPKAICDKRNIRYYWWTRGFIPNTFAMINWDDKGYWKDLKNNFDKLKLTKNDKIEAQKVIDEITKEKKKLYIVGSPTISFKQLKYFFNRFWINIIVEKFRNPYARPLNQASEGMYKWFNKFLAMEHYVDVDYTKKYYFYPLHLSDDAQILVNAIKYRDQIALIKYISDNIPDDYLLFVKEHPNNIGGMDTDDLEKITKINKVRLINPKVDSHDIIKNSQGIITINSTVGFEGLLYGKNVITFGRCLYAGYGMTKDIKDIKTEKLEFIPYNKELVLRYVNALIKTNNKGDLNFYYGHEEQADENIINIAEGIKKCCRQ